MEFLRAWEPLIVLALCFFLYFLGKKIASMREQQREILDALNEIGERLEIPGYGRIPVDLPEYDPPSLAERSSKRMAPAR